jgi:lipopolysaccharide export system protein LptC
MSEQAIRERGARQRWAAKGGRHDIVVRAAGVAMPLAAGMLAAIMIFTPLANTKDVSFVLAKNNVALAKERLRITRALYRGEDSQGRPFRLSAGSAVQLSSKDPVVRLNALSAQIALSEGPATMQATGGRYDMNSETVSIDGPMMFATADGYKITARDVSLNLKTRLLNSGGMVDGRIPLGSFSAGHMSADLATHAVTLDGHAHLHIDQRGGRGWKP